MMRRVGVLVLGCVAAGACRRADAPPATAVTATVAEFGQLQWLAGKWRGSGGAYSAFFEEYVVLDDSTMRMRAFKDSTFSTATDSSLVELRGGTVRNGVNAVAVELTASRVRFTWMGMGGGGYTFERVSADEWTATLHPKNPSGATTVYVMRKVR